MNKPNRPDPMTPGKINKEGKVVPLEEGDIQFIGVVDSQAHPINMVEDPAVQQVVFLVLPDSFRKLMMARRRSALSEANDIAQLLGLPAVCPCCGKKTEK